MNKITKTLTTALSVATFLSLSTFSVADDAKTPAADKGGCEHCQGKKKNKKSCKTKGCKDCSDCGDKAHDGHSHKDEKAAEKPAEKTAE